MSYLCRSLILVVLLCLFTPPSYAQEQDYNKKTTQEIFNQSKNAIYQIRVISKKSGQKKSIGSGFRVFPQGLFVTNYHVISNAVTDPEDYRLEFRTIDDAEGELVIRNIDVINDLAVLELAEETPLQNASYLNFSERILNHGEVIFSMGNPHDLGTTIIDGVYNGLLEDTVYQKILFSGALNSGMSGGPAFDEHGNVIGVNVSTGGDDLSYLVPAKFVQSLLKEPKASDQWSTVIRDQLIKNSEHIVEMISSNEWQTKSFGDFNIPENLHPAVKCWGSGYSESDTDNRSFAKFVCDMDDYVYISSDLYTGNIIFSATKIDSHIMNPFAFSEYYELQYDDINSDVPDKDIDDVSEFQCKSDFVLIADSHWKTAICSRSYNEYDDVFDVYVKAALMGREKEGYVLEVFMDGFSQTSSHKFLQTFLEGVSQ